MATILSWNVNGIRSALKNGFLDFLHQTQPDVLCLQEVRALPNDLSEEVLRPLGYTTYWNPAKKKGYSGTGTFARQAPLSVGVLDAPAHDNEGRLQALEYPEYTILNCYWPNSQPERARLDYKLDYCQNLTELANRLVREGRNVILCGDYNIAHTAIDLARPKENENNPGYYIEERQAMDRFLEHGYVDTFRHFCKDPGQYTWWSYRTRGRERNVGWRLDYHCVNQALLPRVRRSWILSEVMGSDHCPVGLTVE